MAFFLAFLAGCVDAVGFGHLGGLFVSFMSGNTTRLGLSIAAGNWTTAATISGIILSFVLGAATGTAFQAIGPRRRRAALLSLEAAVLIVAVAAGEAAFSKGAAAAMAFAMGMENEVFTNAAGETRVSLTFVSGTLVKLGEGLGRMFSGGPRLDWWRFLILWLSLLAGVVAGGFCFARLGLLTLLGVSLLLFGLAVAYAVVDGAEPHRTSTPAG